jgi:hypothetical protein
MEAETTTAMEPTASMATTSASRQRASREKSEADGRRYDNCSLSDHGTTPRLSSPAITKHRVWRVISAAARNIKIEASRAESLAASFNG